MSAVSCHAWSEADSPVIVLGGAASPERRGFGQSFVQTLEALGQIGWRRACLRRRALGIVGFGRQQRKTREVGCVFVIALLVLGLTYLLAEQVVHLEVVSRELHLFP
jgi:hypothetical protein